jgi:hypothetical protein
VDVIPFISTKIAPERGLWRATAPATFARLGRVRRSEPSGRNSLYQTKIALIPPIARICREAKCKA